MGTLYKYEWKKLLKKKIVWITGGIALVLMIFINMSFLFNSQELILDVKGEETVITRSGYDYMRYKQDNSKALDGRMINQELLKEMQNNYGSGTYADIEHWVYNIMGELEAVTAVNEEDLYQMRQNNVRKYTLAGERLTEEEIEYWTKESDKVRTPFTYQYSDFWRNMMGYTNDINLVLVLLFAICLSGICSDEHRRKTDQLMLCAKNGRNAVFRVKLLTGVTFAVGWTILLYLISTLITAAFYGIDGFSAPIQLEIQHVFYEMTMGKAVLMLFGLTVLAAILISTVAVVLSEILNNSVAVMAVLTGILFLTQILIVPEQYRLLNQIWDYIPSNMIASWQFLDGKTVSIFGQRFSDMQFAYFVYPVLSVIFAAFGWWKYKKFQVSGR